MKKDVRRDHKHFERLADQLLEEWVRQNNEPTYSNLGGGGALNGNLAMTETKRHKRRPRRMRELDDGSFIDDRCPANGKESENGSNQIPRRLIAQYNQMADIMTKIEHGSATGPMYVMVLTYYYTYKSLEIVAKKMKCSETRAKQLKRSAFDQVVLLLSQSGNDS